MNKIVAHPLRKNVIYEHYDVYVGRWNPKIPHQSIWHNPFKIGKDGTREEVIEKFKEYLLKNEFLMGQVRRLKGLKLGCWCSAAQNCHGDVLCELANKEEGKE